MTAYTALSIASRGKKSPQNLQINVCYYTDHQVTQNSNKWHSFLQTSITVYHQHSPVCWLPLNVPNILSKILAHHITKQFFLGDTRSLQVVSAVITDHVSWYCCAKPEHSDLNFGQNELLYNIRCRGLLRQYEVYTAASFAAVKNQKQKPKHGNFKISTRKPSRNTILWLCSP